MGLYSITTRAEGTVLTGFGATTEDIFNGDHENHVTHTAAEFLNSWEEDLAQMQLTASPLAAGGAFDLPASLSDEIERLRYQIALVKQKISGAATAPFWYDATADFSDGVAFPPTAARLEMSATQTIIGNVLQPVSFNTAIYDTASLRSGNALVAPADGVYAIGGTLGFGDLETTGIDGYFELRIRAIAGTTTSYLAANAIYSATDQPKVLTVDTIARLTAGTSVNLIAFQNSGANQVPINNVSVRPAFWMALVGRG